MKYKTCSASQTQKLAASLAQKYQEGAVIALLGPLGAGKTTFVQGFAQGLGIKEKITSPTFILVKEYTIPHHPQGKLFHIDLYRLENKTEIKNLGLEEIWDQSANIVLIEWAEKLENLPAQTITMQIKPISDQHREIQLLPGLSFAQKLDG